jgi:hypothetical protein
MGGAMKLKPLYWAAKNPPPPPPTILLDLNHRLIEMDSTRCSFTARQRSILTIITNLVDFPYKNLAM